MDAIGWCWDIQPPAACFLTKDATMTNEQFREWLVSHGACKPALDWLGDRTPQQAWDECPDPRWMFWWLGHTPHDRKTLVLCVCEIARTVLHLVPEGEDRPRIAIETAEAWARGDATVEQVKEAAAAAYAAYDAAYDAAFAAVAAGAGLALRADAAAAAAFAAAFAAADAADDAYAADYAAADYAAAASAAPATQAAIIRKHFPNHPEIEA
jgi:hypothetical protein